MKHTYAIESCEGHFGPFDDRDAAAQWANHYLRSYPWRMLRLQAPQAVQVAAITEGPHR